jgi:hypothetical protein
LIAANIICNNDVQVALSVVCIGVIIGGDVNNIAIIL